MTSITLPQDAILIDIPDNAQGLKRKVTFLGISNQDHIHRRAEISWIVVLVDAQGNHLSSKDLAQYRMVKVWLSDENKLDNQGNTVRPGEPGYETATPEYTFWWNMVTSQPLVTALTTGVNILAQNTDENGLTVFDR